MDITINPAIDGWSELLAQASEGTVFGHSLKEWFTKTRSELGLDPVKPIVATGHQTLLWHPGILAKYLAVEAFAKQHDLARANLIVDQHADEFGEFDIPVRRNDNTLVVRRLHLATVRKGVPMGLHESFTPPKPPGKNPGTLESVAIGVQNIHEQVYAQRQAPNAARQMAGALETMMQPWVRPMPAVMASELLETTFARKLLQEMAREPERCAEAYNLAVDEIAEAGIGKLLIRDDYVELPLWRIRDDGRRMRAYDNDVQSQLDDPAHAPRLMPRALMLTALVRLGMCDLFVHGIGGGIYDRAMERWIERWLGVKPSPLAVVSATLRLPLEEGPVETLNINESRKRVRRLQHDPESPGTALSAVKAALLRVIDGLPRNSIEKSRAYFEMHKKLEDLREKHAGEVEVAAENLERALRAAGNHRIASRRDWPFMLYPREMIDELACAIASASKGAVCDS